jgi:hypothetical protein
VFLLCLLVPSVHAMVPTDRGGGSGGGLGALLIAVGFTAGTYTRSHFSST